MAHPLFDTKAYPGEYLSGDQFVTSILCGERNFTGIKLEEGFNLDKHKDIEKLRTYCKGQNFEKCPIVLNNAKLQGLIVSNLNLSFLEAEGVDFKGACLININFEHALLRGSGLQHTNLSESSLRYADIHAGFLHFANLSHANAEGVYLHGAILTSAVIKSANFIKSNLDNAYCSMANFESTNLSESELSFANLRSANLDKAYLEKTNFFRAIMRSAQVNLESLKNSVNAEYIIWD